MTISISPKGVLVLYFISRHPITLYSQIVIISARLPLRSDSCRAVTMLPYLLG
ncbi:hypothetical protein OAM34_03300 [Alphaproteobacteria bacterium]|nr:hypothetical protein [Alphaproteobacteria bacterium]